MTCFELAELVTAYLDGALDERSETLLVVHLDGCPACRTLLDQHRQTIRLLGPAAPTAASTTTLAPAYREALLTAFRDAPR
ncbi:anti-sigma factor family protein [Streptacidiphilus jiangxiensis]|uniref:Putative zinc-finger n=1 Tax=Streptacidiphilus jiangxiensis TaxID=235985 RepID=A0A1H7TBB9_STRJI|nr:zf-HC2 domain-containing protein [Streptacidiphilus jiangxiensis]SEL81606.1 Putative zinc-finger [Streptacidiphilus jiangxiensis]